MNITDKTLDEVLDIITDTNLRVDIQVPLYTDKTHYKILQEDGDWIGDVYVNEDDELLVYGPRMLREML